MLIPSCPCRALTWSQRLWVRAGTGITQHHREGNGLLLPLWLTGTWKPLAFSSPVPAVEEHDLLYFISQFCARWRLFNSHLWGLKHTFFCTEILFPNCLSWHVAAGGSQTEQDLSERVKPLPKRCGSVPCSAARQLWLALRGLMGEVRWDPVLGR